MPEFGNPFAGNDYYRKLNDSELIRAIRFSVAAEYEAAQLYTQLADSIDNQLAIDLLNYIAKEEIIHAGEFLKLLEVLAPEEKKLYDEGAKVVEDKIEKQSMDNQEENTPLLILE